MTSDKHFDKHFDFIHPFCLLIQKLSISLNFSLPVKHSQFLSILFSILSLRSNFVCQPLIHFIFYNVRHHYLPINSLQIIESFMISEITNKSRSISIIQHHQKEANVFAFSKISFYFPQYWIIICCVQNTKQGSKPKIRKR